MAACISTRYGVEVFLALSFPSTPSIKRVVDVVLLHDGRERCGHFDFNAPPPKEQHGPLRRSKRR
jgi:hypothetical protein